MYMTKNWLHSSLNKNSIEHKEFRRGREKKQENLVNEDKYFFNFIYINT